MIRFFFYTLFILSVLFLQAVGGADIKSDFSVRKDRQKWHLNKWHGYKPSPRIAYDPKEKALTVSDIKGEYGFGMVCYQPRLPVKAGDKIRVRFCVKGSGEFHTALQYYSQGKWSGNDKAEKRILFPEWKKHEMYLDVKDLRGKITDHAILTFSCPRGSRLLIKSFSAERCHVSANTPVRQLKVHRVLWQDDYENSRLKRIGNPELIRENISPGTLVLSGFGTYSTAQLLNIIENREKYSFNRNDWFAAGFRLQNFSSTGKGKSSLSLNIASSGKRFELQIKRGENSPELLCDFSVDGMKFKQLSVPGQKLPADFHFYFHRNGEFVLQLNSLADSSRTFLTGNANFFRTLSNGHFSIGVLLKSTPSGKASVTIDNVFLGLASPVKTGGKIPFVINLEKEFDPVKAGWKKVFSDEFNGREIDQKKWGFHGNPGYISLDGKGNLQIRTDLNAKGKLETCVLLSKKNFKYGWFEARLKFTREPRCWSAFWLNHDFAQNTNAFLDGVEIDIFEDYYTRSKTYAQRGEYVLDHNLHSRCGFVTLKSWNYISRLPRSIDDYFVIACKWTPFEISYYLDGKQIPGTAAHSPYSTVTYDPFHHVAGIKALKVLFSGCIMNKGYSTINWFPQSMGKYPQYFTVDYVRVYAFPEKDTPSIRLDGDPSAQIVPVNSILKIRAKVEPNPVSKSPIKAVYLFDNGYFIGYRDRAPYTFEFPFNADFLRGTAYNRPGRGGQVIPFDGYPHSFVLFVQDEAGNVSHTEPFTRIPVFGKSTPYKGKIHQIPGKIFIGHYDEGGEGIAYHDTSPGNTVSKTFRPGENADCLDNHLGYTIRHEWLAYTVDIQEGGVYTAQVCYGTPLPGRNELVLLLDDRQIGVFKMTPDKKNNWICSSVAEVSNLKLPAGRHKITLLVDGRFNLKTLSFRKNSVSEKKKSAL